MGTTKIQGRTSSTRFQRNALNKTNEFSPTFLHRMYRLQIRGVGLFGNISDFNDWLNHPNFSLDGKKPMDILKENKDFESINNLLTRIEHGVLA